MPLYLFTGRYSQSSMRAMVDNPQDREAGARSVLEAVGGKLLNLYFCFGRDDLIAIVEMPDDKAMAAASMALGASGALSAGYSTPLMTTKDAMAAMATAKKGAASYKPPAA